LDVSDRVAEKLGRRAISVAEIHQVPGNPYRFGENRRAPRCSGRRLLFGATDGGRQLELVIEPTYDPGLWLVVTGWQSDRRRVR
jgi:hypothetical protein